MLTYCFTVIEWWLVLYFLYVYVGILQAADKALDVLKRMRAGMTAEKRRDERKRGAVKKMSSLFSSKKRKTAKRSVWKHRFVCLAYHDQDKIPTTDVDKYDLFAAGLGEKEVEFETLDMNSEEFWDLLCKNKFVNLTQLWLPQLQKFWNASLTCSYQMQFERTWISLTDEDTPLWKALYELFMIHPFLQKKGRILN